LSSLFLLLNPGPTAELLLDLDLKFEPPGREVVMTNIQAALYARVSSEQQAAAHTIESQLAALTERARNDGTPIPSERQFVDDGYSGAALVRPALDRLRDLAAAGAVNRIYVHSPDRLARNYAYQVLLIDEWRRAGVQVVFLNRPLGQSPEDDLLLQVQGIVAEYERAKIMERSRRGKKHAAQRGSLNVMSGAPFGYRYVTVHEGGGQARFEPIPEQARIVKQVFEWIALERCSLSEVCRRLQEGGERTRTGRSIWSRPAVWHILQNPAYYGKAAFGKTRMTERPKSPRLRPARGRPAQHRKSYVPKAVDQKDWVFVSVPPLIEPDLYRAAHRQLDHNRARARMGRRRAGYLLQGLLACSECRYAYYGKTIHQKGAGGLFRDFVYYRCTGTDGYRFGGERVCNNPQVSGQFIETAVWTEVCKLLKNPQRLEQQYQQKSEVGNSLEHPEILKAQLHKLQRGLERLIDTYSEGTIEKEQFTPRLSRTKARIAELEARIRAQAAGADSRQELQSLVEHFRKLAAHLGPVLENTDWDQKRELIRSVVERVDIGLADIAILFRVPQDTAISITDPILVTLPRGVRQFHGHG
jgi:site-specific DNA recombinase